MFRLDGVELEATWKGDDLEDMPGVFLSLWLCLESKDMGREPVV